MAQPWTRPESAFRHPDLLAWVAEQRPALLHALLTVARAWYARGRPAPKEPVPALGNYSAWARTVGGMLALAGIPGFLTNLDQLWDEADQASAEWAPFLRVWRDAFGDRAVSAQGVHAQVKTVTDNFTGNAHCVEPALRDALPGDLADVLNRPGTFTKRLGIALYQQTDARYGEEAYRVVAAGTDRTRTRLWKVEMG